MNKILYNMCYNMLEQPNFSYKTEKGFAIVCSNTPVWLYFTPKTTAAEMRLFFNEFLARHSQKITGIVAESQAAAECAAAYNHSGKTTQNEIISYYLPETAPLPAPAPLHKPTNKEMPLVLSWLKNFYAETLCANLSLAPEEQPQAAAAISPYILLRGNQPAAMGILSPTADTARINLLYVPPNLRKHGNGKTMLTALAQKARENGRLPVLYTSAANAAANALYASLGFRESGRLTEFSIS